MTDPITDPVAAQYEEWVYPRPIQDLSAPEHRSMRDLGDPCFLANAYWPDRHCDENLDILIAGCGTNAAARYAFHHPKSRVTGIDISSASLAHERYLKDKHHLANLTLHECRVEHVSSLGQDFDFVDASGVLHHLPDPIAGLRALRDVLRTNGNIFVALYGKYGRAGVYMYQELFRLMELDQRSDSVKVVKDAVSLLGQHHFLKHYVDSAPDLDFDGGWIDTFLHRQDVAFTVPQCLQLVESAGLIFQGWMENFYYYPEGQLPGAHRFAQKLNGLTESRLWQAMELINCRIGMHSFFVCRPDRDPTSYRFAFESQNFLECIPVRRVTQIGRREGAAERPLVISRPPFPPFELDAVQTAIFGRIDGVNTARDCLMKSGIQASEPELVEFGRNFFRSLWRIGYLFMRTRP